MDRREAFNGKLAENRRGVARGHSLFAAFHVLAKGRRKKKRVRGSRRFLGAA